MVQIDRGMALNAIAAILRFVAFSRNAWIAISRPIEVSPLRSSFQAWRARRSASLVERDLRKAAALP